MVSSLAMAGETDLQRAALADRYATQGIYRLSSGTLAICANGTGQMINTFELLQLLEMCPTARPSLAGCWTASCLSCVSMGLGYLAIPGGALLGILIGTSSGYSWGMVGLGVGTVVCVGMIFLGAYLQDDSRSQLDRAIWEYNRALLVASPASRPTAASEPAPATPVSLRGEVPLWSAQW